MVKVVLVERRQYNVISVNYLYFIKAKLNDKKPGNHFTEKNRLYLRILFSPVEINTFLFILKTLLKIVVYKADEKNFSKASEIQNYG